MMKTINPNTVDLNLLKVFAAIYAQRNLTRAGERLAMTQSAVSRALDRLHHQFGTKLFYYTEGEMRPTRAAEMMAAPILEALALLDSSMQASKHFDPAQLQLNFKLGANDYVTAVVLPKLIETIRRQAPTVFLSTLPSSYLNVETMLHQQEIDCGITSSLPKSSRIASHPLFREDYVVISCKSHSLSSDNLTLSDYLAAEHLLVSYTGNQYGWVDERLAEMGHKRRVTASVHMFLAIPHIIMQQTVVCTLPRRLAIQFAKTYPIAIHELPFESQSHLFHLVWPRQQTKSTSQAWLRQQIIECCELPRLK